MLFLLLLPLAAALLPARHDHLSTSFCRSIMAHPTPWNKHCHRLPTFSCSNHPYLGHIPMFSFGFQDYYLFTTHFKHLKRTGVYWDIATNAPIAVSNTFFMDRCLGWKGVCAEANPQFFEPIHRERSCHLVPTCISDHEGMVRFLVEGQAGGVKDAEHKHNKLYASGRRVEPPAVNMRCTTMAKVQKRVNGEKAVVVDYLSLDVEGHEMAVLRGVDWEKVRINVITVEVSGDTREVIHDFLTEKGFVVHTPMLDERSKRTHSLWDDVVYVHRGVVWGKPV